MQSVPALHFAATRLLFQISQVLIDERGQPLLVLDRGFSFINHNKQKGSNVADLEIRPNGWQGDSYIRAVFERQEETWCLAARGSIVAPHQKAFVDSITISPAHNALGFKLHNAHMVDQRLFDACFRRYVQKLSRDCVP